MYLTLFLFHFVFKKIYRITYFLLLYRSILCTTNKLIFMQRYILCLFINFNLITIYLAELNYNAIILSDCITYFISHDWLVQLMKCKKLLCQKEIWKDYIQMNRHKFYLGINLVCKRKYKLKQLLSKGTLCNIDVLKLARGPKNKKVKKYGNSP